MEKKSSMVSDNSTSLNLIVRRYISVVSVIVVAPFFTNACSSSVTVIIIAI